MTWRAKSCGAHGASERLRRVEPIGPLYDRGTVVEGGNRRRLVREGPAPRDVTSVDDMAAENWVSSELVHPDSGFWFSLRRVVRYKPLSSSEVYFGFFNVLISYEPVSTHLINSRSFTVTKLDIRGIC
jgi:hypothetical protein